jgi:chemotaxis protein MotB
MFSLSRLATRPRATRPTLRAVFLAAFPLAALLLAAAGCSGPASPPAARLDALEAERAALAARCDALADSLRLYDAVAGGEAARTLRRMQAQQARMAYELATLRDGGRTLATFGADALFAPASATLTDAGRARLDTLAAHLRATYPARRLRVEGHADATPLSDALRARFPSNWALSAARAAAVVAYLTTAHALPADRLALAAYGATRPVAPNDTAAGRRRNRRVRVALLPVPRDYERPFRTSW